MASGIAPTQPMPGTGVGTIPETVDLTLHDLIARPVTPLPTIVVGIKDSAGKMENMGAMVTRFSVHAGADTLLLPLMKLGGAG